MDNKRLHKRLSSLMRQKEARQWIESGQAHTASWEELLRSSRDEEEAERLAEGIMLLRWAERGFEDDLKLFEVINTSGATLLVLAESERQSRAIALQKAHLREFDNGICREVSNCATRWGSGFASAVDRAKAQGFAGPIERKGRYAVMRETVHTPLHLI